VIDILLGGDNAIGIAGAACALLVVAVGKLLAAHAPQAS
jgi:hypothetical protein